MDRYHELRADEKLATIKPKDKKVEKKYKRRKSDSSNEKNVRELSYVDATNIRDILTGYAEMPTTKIGDIKDAVSEILRKNVLNYGERKTKREEIDQILVGLDIGKSALYKALGGGIHSYESGDIKNLAKFVESRGNSLRNILLSADKGKIAGWDITKIFW